MALASAEPETSPNPSQESHLLVARDNVCHIITAGSQGCDWDPYNGKRRTLIKPGMTFGVSCYVTDGKPVGTDKYKRWDYVPGWGCWVSAKWTNSGCEIHGQKPSASSFIQVRFSGIYFIYGWDKQLEHPDVEET
ncbi:hypothetical protein M7I_2136 [Glarea lozoyensis 74030]|uniref:Uncharacterized protein n=1 Tax=Glarea lozoyensis (strain ATCC 74030 / MF5533) TaxID=1104152 RepID=H0EHZ2_GLAL7|nr:hypothetical protein M7I_2136 [Glarea lozoyensis 74030]